MRRIQGSEHAPIVLRVNGREHRVAAQPRMLLSDLLREQLGLTGTHVGCEHGVCGACTVLVDGVSVRSCLTFSAQCAGRDVTTVEGLAANGALSPLQQSFHEHHALQCGFCTPGFLIASHELISSLPPGATLDAAAARSALSGHICRCTGYQNIVKAVVAAAATRPR
jgi:2-furoyl-CoA dehydrogenase 2Fe-2S iron sulfur subunit